MHPDYGHHEADAKLHHMEHDLEGDPDLENPDSDDDDEFSGEEAWLTEH